MYLSAKATIPHHVRKLILISSFKNSSTASAAIPLALLRGLEEAVAIPVPTDEFLLLLWTIASAAAAAMTISPTPNWTADFAAAETIRSEVVVVPGKDEQCCVREAADPL